MLHWLYCVTPIGLLAWTGYRRLYLKERLSKNFHDALFCGCIGLVLLLMVSFNMPSYWPKSSLANKWQVGVLLTALLFMTVWACQDIVFYKDQKRRK